MIEKLDELLTRYERGALGRRRLLEALAAMTGSALAAPASAPSPFQARSINHVTMAVSDIERTRSFYQSILNARVIGRAPQECDLEVGNGFLALMKLNRPPGIDHFCIGIADYDANRVASALAAKGWKPKIHTEAIGVKFKVPQVYVPDPDGIRVQFSSPDYRGEMLPAP